MPLEAAITQLTDTAALKTPNTDPLKRLNFACVDDVYLRVPVTCCSLCMHLSFANMPVISNLRPEESLRLEESLRMIGVTVTADFTS